MLLQHSFRKLRYDNLTSAVKKVLRGHRREETARFVAFRSHWRFEAEFCTPAEPHEKGGIEGEAGYFRRNHWVPVPEAVDVAERNRQIITACQQDEGRRIAGRLQTVGAGLVIEREQLLPLAQEGFDLAQTSFPTVNGLGCAKVLTNTYSVPLPAGTSFCAPVSVTLPFQMGPFSSSSPVCGFTLCSSEKDQILTGSATSAGAGAASAWRAGKAGQLRLKARMLPSRHGS